MNIIPIVIMALIVVLLGWLIWKPKKSVDQPSENLLQNGWDSFYLQASGRYNTEIDVFEEAWDQTGLATQVPYNVAVMAISAHETGWGTSHAARTHNNLTGISGNDEVPDHYECLQDWLTHFRECMNLSRYAKARVAQTPAQFVEALYAGGYNSHASWRDNVLSILANLQSRGWT